MVASRLAAHVAGQLHATCAATPLEWSAVANAFQQLGAQDFDKIEETGNSATQVDKGKGKAVSEDESDDQESNDGEPEHTESSEDKRTETTLRLVRFIEGVSRAG